MMEDYDTDNQTVVIAGQWTRLSQVYNDVQSGKLDPAKIEIPDYPIAGPGGGWFRADLAWEMITRRRRDALLRPMT